MNSFRLFMWLLIGLVSLSLSVSPVSAADCPPNEPARGVIDPNCQKTSLRGLWWAVPGKLIPPNQISQYKADAVTVSIPSYWPESIVNVNSDYPRGLITLWTEIKLTDELADGENLALWPGRQSAAIRIYVTDGRGKWVKAYDNLSVFIDESAQPIHTLPAEDASGLIYAGASYQLPKLYSGSQVILQLYVDDYRTGGIAQPPQIGLKDELHQNLMRRSAWHILFLGASLLVTFFAASQTLFASTSSNRTLYLLLMVMSLGTSLRLLVTGNLLAYIIPSLSTTHHFYLAWMSFLVMLGIFVGAQVYVFPSFFKSRYKLKKLLQFLSVLPISLLCLIPFLDFHEFVLIGHAFRTFYILVAFTYALFLLWQVYLHPKGHWVQLSGIMAVLVSGSFDAYLYAQNVDPYIELFSVAIFAFTASQAIYFGWEHVRLLGRERGLTLNLKELNESLEKQVLKRTQELETANVRLSHAATTDALTKLPNRRAFDAEIESEVQIAKNKKQNLCLAIADLDWFKSVNDQYGHDFGDKALQVLAAYLNKQLRTTDFVARIGGEEFAIILPAADIESTNILLNQLCTNVSKLRINEQHNYHLSISIGCAQWTPGLSIDQLYRLADQALYQAKNNGRGRVEVASTEQKS
ncbi:GGDEF domain-containing protein [Paraglaciecola aquimarina]|uniref:diguanylate cyclase n=1 Tax=Paraglaciecola aquimarina TaxID=1235557 RepID=A0ABU3SS14_9ALTE|nr:GGDEF domain-containing protein [Paraglaciecola aquimarina]MDU0352773.1 GGDEF domain-containing protein [Paraglaciecola aquimarina]